MDYKKKYEEAMERAKYLYGGLAINNTKLEYIFPELKESEDERISKELISLVKEGGCIPSKKDREFAIAYLERKKEQKPAEKSEWYDSMDELIADALIEMVEQSELIDRDKNNRIYWIKKHRKSAEWSEEDEKHFMSIINDIKQDVIPDEEDMNWFKTRFKSIRPQPHWKPTEEQIRKLNIAINCFEGDWGEDSARPLRELFEQLKKL